MKYAQHDGLNSVKYEKFRLQCDFDMQASININNELLKGKIHFHRKLPYYKIT